MSASPPLPNAKLEAILARHAVINDRLAHGPDSETFVALSRELAELEPVVGAIQALRAVEREGDGLAAMLADPAVVGEIRVLAEEEQRDLTARLPQMAREVRLMLLP
jgi:peptide chain release factor 1